MRRVNISCAATPVVKIHAAQPSETLGLVKSEPDKERKQKCPIRKFQTREKFLSLRLPVSRKRKVLFVVVVLAFAACVAGGAGARVTAEEDLRPCGRQPPVMRCHTPGDYDGDRKADPRRLPTGRGRLVRAAKLHGLLRGAVGDDE